MQLEKNYSRNIGISSFDIFYFSCPNKGTKYTKKLFSEKNNKLKAQHGNNHVVH